MDIAQLRRANLATLIHEEFNGDIPALAEKLNWYPHQITRYFSDSPSQKRTVSSDSARKIEIAAGLPPGWLDTNHNAPAGGMRQEDVGAIEFVNQLRLEAPDKLTKLAIVFSLLDINAPLPKYILDQLQSHTNRTSTADRLAALVAITDDEKTLLRTFRRLNQQGRTAALISVTTLAKSPVMSLDGESKSEAAAVHRKSA